MFNFFLETAPYEGKFRICGNDYNHVTNVLRMKTGENLLVSHGGASHLCKIVEFTNDSVIVEIIEENYQNTSLPIEIYLFQGLPKSDKLELIIQKTVELGVSKIIPVEMSRSIVKIEPKKAESKVSRWQAIAESAAKQSKRTVIPTIEKPISFNSALEIAKTLDLFIVPYECKNGMLDTTHVLSQIKPNTKVGIMIGPEGGFSDNEIEKVLLSNGQTISLGKRILRTETAAILSVGAIMLYAEINL
ncbi:MAG: 16S rRNA (uracil(1498)-N(3))-methyltransferase [Clostridiales bacterium]|nr:16S rRNA (uracil(1498)-N(3))-methyltransferase [Clostridiales bacterium]